MGNVISIPQAFDWVSAREKCNGEAAFGVLEETVKQNVEVKNRLDGADEDRYGFRPGDHYFAVNRGRERVVFRLDGNTVHVSSVSRNGEETELFQATPYLLDNGLCRLEIETDAPLEYWQVSRLALESLLFDK